MSNHDRIREIAEQMWQGEKTMEGLGPWETRGLSEVADRTAFVLSFANVTAFGTDEGLVLVDTGSFFLGPTIFEAIRRWSSDRVHTAIYTHGHVDHVFGITAFDREAKQKGWRTPRVIAHEDLPARFDRYVEMGGYNGHINARQFNLPAPVFPTEYRYPDEVYRARRVIDVGDVRFELFHARGETDDATWVWVPERKVLCTGDCFVWVTPNCGNPQKAPRYAPDWARALRQMEALGAETLCPGHGPPIFGAERVRQALGETAEWLESIVEQTVARMNAGHPLDAILRAVRPPAHLKDRPYLQPVYDEPEFIVQNLWRLLGGWYDGDPAHLKPAPTDELAREVAELAGGAELLADRAEHLADRGRLALAAHLAEWAARAAPQSKRARTVRKLVYERRSKRARSLMARNIFGAAARR